MAFNDKLLGLVELKKEGVIKERYHGDEAVDTYKRKDVLSNPDTLVSVNLDETMPDVFKLPELDTDKTVLFGEETAQKVSIVQGLIRTKLREYATRYRVSDTHDKALLMVEASKLSSMYFSLEEGKYDHIYMETYHYDNILKADDIKIKSLSRTEKKEKNEKQKAWKRRRKDNQQSLYDNMKKNKHAVPTGLEEDDYKSSFEHEIQTDFLNSDFMREKLKNDKAKIKDAAGKSKTVTQEELLKMVLKNDFSNIEKLDPVARNILASIYMQKIFLKNVGPERDEEKIVEKLKGMESHPLLRIGISLAAQGRLGVALSAIGDKEWFQRLDELLNTKMMENTLTAIPTLADGIDEDAIKRNAESQLFIAKTMLVCHMGKFNISENKEKSPWEQNTANAFAHCSRVGIILPGVSGKDLETEQDKMIDSYTGKGQGLLAGFKKRKSATHAINKKSKNKDDFKEKKWYGYNPWGQFGMDVAIGGLGNDGITGAGGRTRKYKNDGTSGHLYMKMRKGDKSTHTGMLIGFESDSYKHTNQLGHTHGWGNGEFQSSFGGQRVDEVGDKYGGRTADLSAVEKEDFVLVMDKFEAVFKANQAAGAEGAEKNAKIVKQLCGKYMTAAQYLKFLKNTLGLDNEDARRIVGARPA